MVATVLALTGGVASAQTAASNKPAPVEADPVEQRNAAGLAPPRLELIGTVIGSGNALAMFRDLSSGRDLQLRVGGTSNGWRLISIEATRVTFEQRDARLSYALVEKATAGVRGLQRPAPAGTPRPGEPRPATVGSQTRPGADSSPETEPTSIVPARGDLPAFVPNRIAQPDPVAERLRRVKP